MGHTLAAQAETPPSVGPGGNLQYYRSLQGGDVGFAAGNSGVKAIGVNCLWPRTTIATAAIENNFPEAILKASRKPAIVADAAYMILTRDSRSCSGNFFIDEEVLREAGVMEFGQYAASPGTPLFGDLFLG